MLFALCVMTGLRNKSTAQVVEITTTDTIVCCGTTTLHTSLLNPTWTDNAVVDYPGNTITVTPAQMGNIGSPAMWSVGNNIGSVFFLFWLIYSPPPTPHLPTDTNVCTSGVLNPGSYASYLWSTGTSTQTLTVTATGNYSVTVNDGYCSGSTVSHVNVEKDSVVLCNVSIRPQGGAIVRWLVLSGINPSWNVVVQRSAGIAWGTVAITSYGDSTATDVNAVTDLNAYKYRVFVQSATCGNSVPSLSQGTILLSNTGINWTWQNPDGLNNLQYIVWEHTTTGSNIPVDTLLSCTGTSCANTSPMVPIPGYNVDYGYVMYSNICSYGKSILFLSRSNNSSCLITGIGVPSKEVISIYPNPTADISQISGLMGEFTTAVYDYSGRLVLQGEHEKTIDLSRFRSGIYMIKIVSERGVYMGKVVKE